MSDRRSFLKGAAATAVIALVGTPVLADDGGAVGPQSLHPMTFPMLPLGSVAPTGWLKRQLVIQASGLSRHLDDPHSPSGDSEIYNSPWRQGSNPEGGGYNLFHPRGPLYVDGIVALTASLDHSDDLRPMHAAFREKLDPFLTYTLASARPNGMFGPAPEKHYWWGDAPMLRALAQWHEYSGDAKTLALLQNYFSYMDTALDRNPLMSGKSETPRNYPLEYSRWVDICRVVQWTYDNTPDADKRALLFRLSSKLHHQGLDWIAAFASPDTFTAAGNYKVKRRDIRKPVDRRDRDSRYAENHGVNMAQSIKTAALVYRMTGDPAMRGAFKHQVDMLDRYHGQASGMFSCDENLAGREPQHGSELCSTVETMLSLEIGLATFGDAWIADRIEKIAYNMLPSQLTEDMTKHQYVGTTNQIFSGVLDVTDDHAVYVSDPADSNKFDVKQHIKCCTSNYHQGWPKLASSLWMRSADGTGLVAAIIAPSTVTAHVGKGAGQPVTVTTVTDYPFKDKVTYVIGTGGRSVSFPLSVRVPAWAGNTAYTVYRKDGSVKSKGMAASSAYTPIGATATDEPWADGDSVVMAFPMTPRIVPGDAKANGGDSQWISVEAGALVFAYPLDGVVSHGQPGSGAFDTPTADQIKRARPFNVAFGVDQHSTLRYTPRDVTETPFSTTKFPGVISNVPAYEIDWPSVGADQRDWATAPPKVANARNPKTVTLVPYGCAQLRMTCVPQKV